MAVQNNFVSIIIPTMIKISGKKIIIRIPGMIRKCGRIIITSKTSKSAPKNLRPKINTIPNKMMRTGTVAKAVMWNKLPKSCPIPEKNSPKPGRLMSQPLFLRIQRIPTMMSTYAQNDPEFRLCSIRLSIAIYFDDVNVIRFNSPWHQWSVSKSLKSANGFFWS